MCVLQVLSNVSYQTGPESFPEMVGSYKQLAKPALEFVKVICGVLKLDSAVEEQVSIHQSDSLCKHMIFIKGLLVYVSTTQQVVVMRRQLLAQLGIREFSDEGLLTDYCRSFILPDLICTFCSHCRDLDICRDERK